MVIYNIPKQGYQRMTPSERLPPLWRKSMEGKTQGKSARSLSGRQPEDKKPPMKGTPPMDHPRYLT